MKQLINDIYEIIKDYRQDEDKMSVNRIDGWIKQFPEADRIFILTELKSILAQRYFSKSRIVHGLEKIIKEVSKIHGFATPADFLKVTSFIDHQPDGKSQKDFLALLREISLTKFGLNLSNHNPANPRFFIYLDDLLCTGDTLFKGLVQKIFRGENNGWLYQKINNQTHLDYLLATNAKILILYFIIHKHNYSNFKYRLKKHLEQDISNYYTPYAFKWIENDFKNINSKLDYLFPTKDNQPQNILDYSKSLNFSDLGVYRVSTHPTTETFFSSKENRIRFENIMLEQGMSLYELAGDSRSGRMRPLGYGLTSHKNLGFGTLCFTYRNVPFNTPLVFWYGHNWKPLFERKIIFYD